MAAHVPAQFAALDRRVVALIALVRSFVRVDVPGVTYQLSCYV